MNNQYNSESFEKCVFNPLDKLFEKHPHLAVFGDERLIKYAILCYDPGSPLRVDYPDWARLKEVAANIAGYNLDTESGFLETLYNGEDTGSLDTIHDFIRTYIRSRKWAMIVSNEETFWEYNKRLKQPIKIRNNDKDEVAAIEKKSRLAADQEVFDARIDKLYEEFYLGDKDMAEVAQKKIRMTPQQIAKALKGGENV